MLWDTHDADPKDVAALAEELNEASQVLDQYRKSLESDLERRGNFITMLTECIVQQENTMNQTTNTLQDCLRQLARAEELKNQIKVPLPLVQRWSRLVAMLQPTLYLLKLPHC
jgi:hypothetical protein